MANLLDRLSPRVGSLILIGGASALNVGSGVILKETGRADWLWWILAGISAAAAVNLGRFFLWREAHRRYPLSATYPLTGLTFPIAILVALLYDEPVGWQGLAATGLIAVGVAQINNTLDDAHADR